MTLHHHWLWNYILKHVPIKLTDNTIVYSAEIGSVVFESVIDGKSSVFEYIACSAYFWAAEQSPLCPIFYLPFGICCSYQYHPYVILLLIWTIPIYRNHQSSQCCISGWHDSVCDSVCTGCNHSPAQFSTLASPIHTLQSSWHQIACGVQSGD